MFNNPRRLVMRVPTIILLIAALALFGCSSDPEKPAPVAEPKLKSPPRTIQLHMVVSDQVNPDVDGRPSPIVIRIYELKSLGKFEEGDFYKLFENYDAHLGPELIVSEEFHLKPGDVNIIKRTLSDDTRYIAVSAAFRDINQALWKDTIQLTDEKITDLLVFIEKLNTSVWKK
jgi:type VI secretion system protein VasD